MGSSKCNVCFLMIHEILLIQMLSSICCPARGCLLSLPPPLPNATRKRRPCGPCGGGGCCGNVRAEQTAEDDAASPPPPSMGQLPPRCTALGSCCRCCCRPSRGRRRHRCPPSRLVGCRRLVARPLPIHPNPMTNLASG